MHIHVQSADGEAKFWLEPKIEVATRFRYSTHQLWQIHSIIEAHRDDFEAAWRRHFRYRGD